MMDNMPSKAPKCLFLQIAFLYKNKKRCAETKPIRLFKVVHVLLCNL